MNKKSLWVCFVLAVFLHSAASAAPKKPVNEQSSIRPFSVPPELDADMARYSLRAYENTDAANPVKGLLFTPKPVGANPLPVIVYIPGCGEIGEVGNQFRQRAIFDRVTSSDFQDKYPCYLLAVSPPQTSTTLLGGLPGRPADRQKSVHEFAMEVCRTRKRPKADMGRIYLTGFSYGGNGVYALAQHFPERYAAAVPIAALPPLPEYFSKERPGFWWHFHNEGDYTRHGLGVQRIEEFAKLVNDAGGDFRIGQFPSEGHDAWTKAWREDAVWDWMFAKSLNGPVKQLTKRGRKAAPVSLSLASAVCTSSVPGIDDGHGPERVVDGLDSTWYEPSGPFGRDDWWQVDLQSGISGRFNVVSGNEQGAGRVKGGFVETSSDGKRWVRAGSFSAKDGVCSFLSRGSIRYLRVKSAAVRPQNICLRRLAVVKDGR